MRFSLLRFAVLILPAAVLLAQGPLTPPGAPAATGKTLDQLSAQISALDPRTSIPAGTTTYVISAPGSYVLRGNLGVTSGNGITINANDVTLDL